MCLFNTELMVGGDVSLNSKLFVADDVSFNTELMVGGDVSLSSKLFVADDVSFNTELMVGGDVSLNSKLFVADDVSFNTELMVGGDVSLNGKLFVMDDVSFNAELIVGGDVSLNSKLFVADDVSFNTELMVGGDVSLNSKLFVADDVSFNTELMVGGDVSVNSKLFVADDVSFNTELMVGGDVSLNSKLFVADDVSLNTELLVGGDVSLNSKLFVADDVSLNTKLMVGGDVSMNSKLFVAEDVSFNEKLTVSNVTTLNSVLNVIGDASLNSKLFVSNDVSLNSNVSVGGDMSVNGDLEITGNLSVFQNKTTTTITTTVNNYEVIITEDLSLNGNFSINGDTSMNGNMLTIGNIDISGDIIPVTGSNSNLGSATNPFNSIYVSDSTIFFQGSEDGNQTSSSMAVKDGILTTVNNNVTRDSVMITSNRVGINKDSTEATATLDVSGNVYVKDTTELNGDVSMNSSLFVNSTTTLSGDVSLNSKLFVVDDVSFNAELIVGGDVSLNSKLFVANDVSFNTELMVGGDVSLNSKLFVVDDVSFNTELMVGGDVSLNSKLFVADDVSFNTELMVGGDVSLNRKLFVVDDVSFDSNLSIGGDVSMNGNMLVIGTTTLSGDASFNGRVDICGNFYAQYPNNSIPATSISGGTLTVSTIQGTTPGTEYSNINTVRFDTDSGFDVTDLSDGVVKVGMNSTFKTWKVDGQDSLVASGLDEVEFIAGDNIAITTNEDIGGNKSITFAVDTGSSSGSGGGSLSGSVNNYGQSFFDILTQQPGMFSSNGSVNSTGTITISWDFDDIVPNITSHTDRALLNLYTASSSKYYLPNINQIRFDLSHSSLSSGWNYHSDFTMTIGTNDYNSSSYKSLVITKQTSPNSGGITGLLSSLNKFDILIYGVNDSQDYPSKEVRGLSFEQVFFKEATPPNDPTFLSSSSSSNNVTLNYRVNSIDSDDANSIAKLDDVDTKYRQNATLSTYDLVTGISTDEEDKSSSNIGSNGTFTSTLSSLRFGTNYEFLTRISNTFTSAFNISDANWNDETTYFGANATTSAYTHLPTSTGITTGNSQGPNSSELKYNKTTSSTSGFAISSGTVYNADNHIYMNPNINTNMAATSTQTEVFEISNPTITGNSLAGINSGIGSYLDGVTNIASLTVTLDSTQKEQIQYNGFTANTGSQTVTYTGNNQFLSSVSQGDMYSSTTQKGFPPERSISSE